MLYCYSKKCFTGIIILMLMLANTGYAAIRETTPKPASKNADQVTGTVVNKEGKTLKNVKVSVKGSQDFVVTDSLGHFGISASAGSELVFSLPNYNVSELTIGSKNNITVLLHDTYLQQPEQVDVLYGTQSKESVLGAMSTIYTNQITTTPASLYVYALPGQLPGLYTHQTAGFTSLDTKPLADFSPFFAYLFVDQSTTGQNYNDNSEITLNLRGQTPITIIDGVQRNISSIDPESIASISVLKDALSTMLLGINSSNGVLLVTTKKAEAGKASISFTAQSGVQNSLNLPTPLPAYQWAYLYNEALANDGQQPYYTAGDFAAYKNHTDPYGHPDVNWYNTILRKNAPITDYQLNVSGGTNIAKYTIGLSYFNQAGIFNTAPSSTYNTNNDLTRYNINSDIQVQVNKNLSVELQLFGRIQQAREPGGGTQNILNLLAGTPNNAYPVYNANGSFGGSSLGTAFTNNLLAMTEYSGYIQNNLNDILANLDMNYNLGSVTKGLSVKLKGNVSYESGIFLDRSLQNPAYIDVDSVYSAIGATSSQNNTFNTFYTSRQSYGQAALNYSRQFGKHSITALAMYDVQSTVTNFDLPATTTNRALQVSYNYEGKYFAQGVINSSGYNRYPPGHQFGLFYAGGLGWQMGKESFIKDNLDWISSWKWRVSYGKTGSDVNASYYGYVQTYSNPSYSYIYVTGANDGTNQFAFYPQPISVNPVETWELSHKLDIGTDISLFKDHLQITGDYYHDRYTNLLETRGASVAFLGVPYPLENIGINLYHGIEVSATYQDHIDKFNYFLTGNISTQASKVIFSDEETPLYPWLKHTGLPVNAIYGYKADGFYQNAADAAKGATFGSYTPKAGDIKLEDLNNDGVINQFDIAPIGNLKALVFYGGTVGFNYQGFSLSVMVQGVLNNQVETNNMLNEPFLGLGGFNTSPQGQAYVNATARWTPETAATAKLPELSFVNYRAGGYNSQLSSFYIKSGDYIRVKNAEVGYTLPYAWSSKLKVSSIRVFANGENLFTLAGYGGADPETYANGGNFPYPIQRVISAGVSVKL